MNSNEAPTEHHHDCSCHLLAPCSACEACRCIGHPECQNDCSTCTDHDSEDESDTGTGEFYRPAPAPAPARVTERVVSDVEKQALARHQITAVDQMVRGYPGTAVSCSCGRFNRVWGVQDGSAEADGHGHRMQEVARAIARSQAPHALPAPKAPEVRWFVRDDDTGKIVEKRDQDAAHTHARSIQGSVLSEIVTYSGLTVEQSY